MAEFEEIEEIIDDAVNGIDDEAAEGDELGEEERHELEEEAAEAAQAGRALVKALNKLGDFTVSFLKYVAKEAAVGAVFYGVSVLLKKLLEKNPAAQQQYKKIKAISEFINPRRACAARVTVPVCLSVDLLIWHYRQRRSL